MNKLKKLKKPWTQNNKNQKLPRLLLVDVEEDFNQMIMRILIKNIRYFNKKAMRVEDGINKYIKKFLKIKISQTHKIKTSKKCILIDMDHTTSSKRTIKQNNSKSQTF